MGRARRSLDAGFGELCPCVEKGKFAGIRWLAEGRPPVQLLWRHWVGGPGVFGCPLRDPAVKFVEGHIEVLQFDGHAQGSGCEPLLVALVALVTHPVAGLHDDALTVGKQFLAQPLEMVAEGLTQRVVKFDAELRRPPSGLRETADRCTASRRAKVVFPEPGGPYITTSLAGPQEHIRGPSVGGPEADLMPRTVLVHLTAASKHVRTPQAARSFRCAVPVTCGRVRTLHATASAHRLWQEAVSDACPQAGTVTHPHLVWLPYSQIGLSQRDQRGPS